MKSGSSPISNFEFVLQAMIIMRSVSGDTGAISIGINNQNRRVSSSVSLQISRIAESADIESQPSNEFPKEALRGPMGTSGSPQNGRLTRRLNRLGLTVLSVQRCDTLILNCYEESHRAFRVGVNTFFGDVVRERRQGRR